MSDQHQEILWKLAELRRMVDEAVLTPWRSSESADAWSLHGEARQFRGRLRGGAGPGMQILKAAKRGTPYAEYWPTPADGALIVESVNRMSFWLDWAEDVARRHHPVVCGCESVHLLCAENRARQWGQCPEVAGLVRAVEMLHG